MNPENASAYLELRPLENTNFGSIIENHNRYYRQYKEQKDAQKLAEKNRESEFARKISKGAFSTYEGIKPQDLPIYLRDQITTAFDNSSDEIMQLAKVKEAGGEGATQPSIKLEKIKSDFQALSDIGTMYDAQNKALADTRKTDYNEFLDGNLDEYQKALGSGLWVIDKDRQINLYDPTSETMKKVEPTEMRTNSFLTATYSGKADFPKAALEISKNLLDTVDGQKLVNENTPKKAIPLINTKFASDPVLAKSWFVNAKREGYVDFRNKNGEPIDFEEMNEVQANALSKSFYDHAVLSNIQQTSNPLAIEGKELINENRRKEGRNKDLQAQKTSNSINDGGLDNEIPTISIATTTDGEPLQTEAVYKPSGLKQFIVEFPKGNDTENKISYKGVNYTGARVDKKGNIMLLGYKETKDENTKEIVGENFVETDINIINSVANLIPNGKGTKGRFKNAKELADASLKLINIEPAKTSKKGRFD